MVKRTRKKATKYFRMTIDIELTIPAGKSIVEVKKDIAAYLNTCCVGYEGEEIIKKFVSPRTY